MPIQAPAARTYPVVEQATYDAVIESITVLDYTVTPFQLNPQFKPRFGHQFLFSIRLEDVTDDQGFSITIPLYAWLETGDRPVKQGPRKGKLPQLTEITRALGEPDILPETYVDEQAWVNRGVRVGVILEPGTDGTLRNKINAVGPRKQAAATPGVVARQAVRPAARPAPAPVAFSNDDEIAF